MLTPLQRLYLTEPKCLLALIGGRVTLALRLGGAAR